MKITRPLMAGGVRLLVIAAAIAVGLVLQRVVQARLDAIQALAARDVVAARAELALVLQAAGGGVFALTTVVGVAMAVAARRGLATEVFPPPGMWSWGAPRTVTGARAKILARVTIGLAVVLTACSLAGLGLVLYMAQRLLACRA